MMTGSPQDIYEYFTPSQLGVNQEVFYKYLGIADVPKLNQWIVRGKLRRLRTAGNGRKGLIDYTSIPKDILKKIKDHYGDPYAVEDVQKVRNRIQADEQAAIYYQRAGLSPEKEIQYYTEAIILNLYRELLSEWREKSARNSSFKITQAKKDIARIFHELKTVRRENGDQVYPHKLPKNWRSLDRKYREYDRSGYSALVHKGHGNKAAQKIDGKVADWILATYCLPNKPNTTVLHAMYEERAELESWPSLSESAIYHWLEQTEQKKKWVLARHGRDEYVRIFGHKVTRDKSDYFPCAYLAIDGTKLDWIHYKEDSSIKMGADIKIDVVFDIYSERIVGWDFGTEHESHQQHFRAFKMAMQETGKKPLLITYDNQGGHRTQPMQDLYTQLLTTGGQHYPHRANEHGSPVEQLFSRFQQQILNQYWFSDKQAVNVRKADSRPNMDFIKKFKHKLKTVEELEEVFELCIDTWNNKNHPHLNCSRDAAFAKATEHKLDELTTLESMNLFWVKTPKPSTYRREGITITVTKQAYQFEVYDADGHVDVAFRDKYTGCKFITQYDPDELDNYVRLYLQMPDKSLKYITDAQPVKKVKTLPSLMDDRDKGRVHHMTATRDRELEGIEKELEALRHRTGITEESLIEDQELIIKHKGRVPKKQRAEAEARSFIDEL